jgi:hypothetical protein
MKALSMLAVFLFVITGTAAAQIEYPYQYAAKILCTSNIPGTSQTTDSLLPGNYETVVNIHNPNTKAVRLRKKIATPSGVSKFVKDTLKDDEATSVNCTEITQKFGLHFIHGAEGFLVIESTQSLDVIAVYTAGRGDVTSIDVERVQERKLP